MTRPTREAAKGTEVTLDFGGTVLTGHLNDSETARALADRLPVTVDVGCTDVDFCGQLGIDLPYDEAERGNGWLDGDINYNPMGGWFVVFKGGEEDSSAYDDQVNVGVVDCDLEELRALPGPCRLTVDLA